MNNRPQFKARIRFIAAALICCIVVSGILWLAVPMWRPLFGGLIIGEIGGGASVASMFRQGHANDDLQGPMLMLSGVIGYFIRILVLVAVMLVASRVHVNVYASLVGYLLGFAILVTALYGYARK